MSAGFAKPANQAAQDPVIHWWRPDDRRACSPDDNVGYSGARKPSAEVSVAEACPDCLRVVLEAKAVLG